MTDATRKVVAVAVLGALVFGFIALMRHRAPTPTAAATSDAGVAGDASAAQTEPATRDAAGEATLASSEAVDAQSVSLRSLAQSPPPPGRTAAPRGDAWKDAEAVALDGESDEDCGAEIVREWLRITCTGVFASAVVLAGSAEGVAATADPNDNKARLVLPVRRGDRRVIQLERFVSRGYRGEMTTQAPGFTVSEAWVDDTPRITLHRAAAQDTM